MAAIPAADTVQMQVQVPANAQAGTPLQVQAPSGQMVQVVVPANVSPGQTITVSVPASVTAATEDDYEAYVPLEDRRYDVTDPCESIMACIFCPCMGYPTRALLLTDQEVTYTQKNLCGTSKQKRPYAQLGSVDKHTLACGCHTLVSDFAPLNEKGEGGIKVGCCGTDAAAIDEIVGELQGRKSKRGGIAQIRKLDYVIGKMAKIMHQVPQLLLKTHTDWVKGPRPEAKKDVLEHKDIDVTNNCELVLGCTTRSLTLDANEATLEIQQCFGCNTIRSKREYGEMGFVEKQKNCICCFSVKTDISPIPGQSDMAPGCPCTNRSKVSALVRELRDRMAIRGQVGQIRKQEKILDMISTTDEHLKKLLQKEGMAVPTPQAVMKNRFGKDFPELTKPLEAIEKVDDKTHDVTSTIDAVLTLLCSCGIAGWTTETMELKDDVMYIKVKNNLDDSDMKIPYAEMDSVDLTRACCCCYTVNEQNPGCGCQKEKVKEIEEDLQERKKKRGNIAHLKQLRSMQVTAVGLNAMTDMLLSQYGAAYPPGPHEMEKIFGQEKPRALRGQNEPHVEPDTVFEQREFTVTNYPAACIGFICCPCAGCTSEKLDLQPDEMVITREDFCSDTTSRVPYGNMGAVETETFCCCCVGLPDIAIPGMGCSTEVVDEIQKELQERKVKRGNIAQMKQQENIIIEVLNVEAKMDVICHKKGIEYPPSQEVMGQLFSADREPQIIGAQDKE